MRIRSIDDKAWLDLSRDGNGPHSSFSIACCVDNPRGKFSAQNDGVHFLHSQTFVATLDAFVLNRELTPTLNAPDDTQVRFVRGPSATVVMVAFAIADAYCGQSAISRYKIQGTFAIDVEQMNGIVSDFEQLFWP